MVSKPVKKMDVKRLTIITAINMMGSGIILLPANLAGVGTISVLSWIVTTAGATCLAYAFARAGTFSNHGAGMGGYAEYAHKKSGSFMTNYTYFISLVIANTAIAVAVVGYGSNFLNITLKPWPTAIATVGVLWLATVAELRRPAAHREHQCGHRLGGGDPARERFDHRPVLLLPAPLGLRLEPSPLRVPTRTDGVDRGHALGVPRTRVRLREHRCGREPEEDRPDRGDGRHADCSRPLHRLNRSDPGHHPGSRNWRTQPPRSVSCSRTCSTRPSARSSSR